MRAKQFEIGSCKIGQDNPCFVVAEAGVSHFGSFEKAKKLVDLAVRAGANAVKFQIFDVDKMISSESQSWKTRLGNRCLSHNQFKELKEYCEANGIIFLATPHDDYGLDVLVNLDVLAYKVGSGEYKNWSFIQKILALGKPVILSTGMYSLNDVSKVVEVCEELGNHKVALLHCVTQYPVAPKGVDLNVLTLFQEKYGGVVGYSDHTEEWHIPLAAVALGAKVIEKHITLEFNIPNAQDWKVSCGPNDFAIFIAKLRDVELALGSQRKEISDEELESRLWACKSLVLAHDHRAGENLKPSSLLVKRPGTGISPDQIEAVLGRKLRIDIEADRVLKWEHLT